MNNMYKPEGRLIATSENREYTASVSSLERANANGKILEGIASFCRDGENGKELFSSSVRCAE